jgi:sugar lactone lactonase YvrE
MYALMNANAASPAVDRTTLPGWTGVVGAGLVRPECVLATFCGDVFSADWRGGVVHLRADGSQRALYLAPRLDGELLRPNGIALLADGSFLLAHLGEQRGGVFRLTRDSRAVPWLTAVDGIDLPPTNFVARSNRDADAIWITVSTRRQPRALAYRADCNDGFVVRVDERGARIVADGLGYTNEVAEHGGYLYVNETFGRRLSRFALHADGSLGPKEVVCSFGAGTFPDGLAFDEAGHAWIVSIVSNRLIRVAPDGTQSTWLEDADADHLTWVEAAYTSGTMSRPHLDRGAGRWLRNISSIAFCGPDRREALLGCLLGDTLHRLRLPAPGIAPPHWNQT